MFSGPGAGKLGENILFTGPGGDLGTPGDGEANCRPIMAMVTLLNLPLLGGVAYSGMLSRCLRSPPKLQVYPQPPSYRSQLPSQSWLPSV